MPAATTASIRPGASPPSLVIRTTLSTSEYSVCRWRWTNMD
jgi:hypothetical protein